MIIGGLTCWAWVAMTRLVGEPVSCDEFGVGLDGLRMWT